MKAKLLDLHSREEWRWLIYSQLITPLQGGQSTYARPFSVNIAEISSYQIREWVQRAGGKRRDRVFDYERLKYQGRWTATLFLREPQMEHELGRFNNHTKELHLTTHSKLLSHMIAQEFTISWAMVNIVPLVPLTPTANTINNIPMHMDL